MSDIKVTSGTQEIIAQGIAIPFESGKSTIEMVIRDIHFEFVFEDDIEVAKSPDNKHGIINLTPIMEADKAIGQKITIINANNPLGICNTKYLPLWRYSDGNVISLNFALHTIGLSKFLSYCWYFGKVDKI